MSRTKPTTKPSPIPTFEQIDRQYQLIVVDPPWPLKKPKRKTRPVSDAKEEYKTLTLNQIHRLPIPEITDPTNCLLFLWTTNTYLFDSREILEGWGFKYLLTMVWEKTSGRVIGGFHWRNEFILVGYLGEFGKQMIKITGKAIPTVFQAPSPFHSAKPDQFYSLIKTKFPGPRIDLFARKKRKGFDVWGDEINGKFQREENGTNKR